ncbi:hypothetical protein OTU49_000400 [Cherax quadricarinatus]|uniref:Fe2OG dioxygenase domain-containing protein n=1 Tax=Cherax quadricarinatus TaxID=27406 RepID=A0AAW0YC87_CHEQU
MMKELQQGAETNIPVVDLGEIGVGGPEDPSEEDWRSVGEKLVKAFSEIGFVYLSNHGVPSNMVDEVNTQSGKFFELDETTKLRYKRGKTEVQGYTTPGQERLITEGDVRELRESYDVQHMDGMFPDEEVSGLRPSVKVLIEACKKLASRLLTAIAIGLDLDRSFFVSTHNQMCSDNNSSCLRLLYYPSVPTNVCEGATRCGAHTDYGTITLLFQDNLGGLEVRDREGTWMNANPILDTVLVNVGDLLQYWTADKLRATEHRVLIPKEEMLKKIPRRSVVFFVHPDNPVLVKPIDGSTSYDPVTVKMHIDKRFEDTYQY